MLKGNHISKRRLISDSYPQEVDKVRESTDRGCLGFRAGLLPFSAFRLVH